MCIEVVNTMAIDIPFFQGVAVVIFASVGILTTFYFQVARKLESRVEEITVEKAWIVEGDLIKCLLVTSALCTQKMYKMLSEKIGEETVSRVWDNLPEYIRSIMRMPQEAMIVSLDERTLPKELVEAIRLGDEERDRLSNLSFLVYALKELVPEIVSYEVDKLTKAIICGVILGLSVPTLDFLMSQNLSEYLFLLGIVSGIIIVTGYYYVKDGILGIWSIRELENKIRKFKRDKNIEDIEETIEGIIR